MPKDEDGLLEKRVKEALDGDVRTKEYGLAAQASKGWVTVSGVVDTLAEKEQAGRVAASVPGVRGVESAVAVSTDGAIRDEDVEYEVGEELQAAGVDLRRIGVKSVRGVVYLTGRAESPEEMARAKTAAAKARGVKEVVCRVKLLPLEGRGGEDLEDIFHGQVNNDREGEERPRMF